jgi:hypothetical protein
VGTNPSLTAPEGERPVHFNVLADGRELAPEELPVRRWMAHGFFGHQGVTGFNLYSMLVAIAGAVVLLVIAHAVLRMV